MKCCSNVANQIIKLRLKHFTCILMILSPGTDIFIYIERSVGKEAPGK